MRYTPDDPAFAGDFVEFSDSWSRAQVRAVWDAIPTDAGDAEGDEEAAFLACLRPKIIALHLTCVDAPPITQAVNLTPERTAEMDTRVYQWFSGVWLMHLRELTTLGNALRERLFVTSAPAPTTKAKPKAQGPRHRRS